MTLATRIYDKLPTALQNAATSARGMQLRRFRYTDYTWQRFEELQRSQWWTAAELRAYQEERLRVLVEGAFNDSPHYADKYRSAGLTPADVRTLDDLPKLPILRKEELRTEWRRIVPPRLDRRRLWVAYTSGTTGTPLQAFYTPRAFQERIAFCERAYQWYNPKRFRRRASFTGKLMVPVDRKPRSLHRTNWAMNQYLFSSHHLAEEHLPRYLSELARIAPEQIDGILSPIFVVAQHAIRAGRAGWVRPAAVFPSSETLWAHMRQSLSTAFACPVANFYGSQEGAPIAYECPRGGFHMCLESGIFEVLRPDGAPCRPGEMGELVVTAFTSEATPLIRYAIGDVATLSADGCACGRGLPLLAFVHGRVDDMFYTTERGLVPRVDSAFKSIPSCILMTQVAQVGRDSFEVRIVVDRRDYKPEHGDQLLHNLGDYLGRRVQLQLKFMDRIPTTQGGKVKAMVNECRSREELREIRAAWDQLNAG
ncbi:MAG TPA: hypothetical protein VE987_15555 [Polyangiaceae bacterium]|nr:hypothetical protein [Polyangiaceae bacterium]